MNLGVFKHKRATLIMCQSSGNISNPVMFKPILLNDLQKKNNKTSEM